MAPRAGPAKNPTLWIADDATFAAVGSAGVVASCGMSPANAGSAGVAARLTSAARQKATAWGAPDQIASAAASMRLARTRSVATSTATRGNRSPSIDEKGEAAAAGIIRTSDTTAATRVPPAWYA